MAFTESQHFRCNCHRMALYFRSYIFLSHKLRCYRRISGLEKSRKNKREKISYFFTCVDKANQLLARHSPLAPLGQVYKRRSLHDLQVVSRDFLELWWLKHQKIRIADRQSGSNFPSREGNQYTKRKTESCAFRGVCVSFLTAENENRQLEDLSLADFGRLPERLLLSVRTKSINENFVN